MYKKAFSVIFFLTLVLSAISQNYITLHEDCNFQGKSYYLETGNHRLYQIKIGNDRLSSIQIPYGFKVTIYADDNFSGNSKTFTENVTCLEPEWNNMASSIVVENTNYLQGNLSDYVVFYNDCYSKGFSRTLRPGIYKGNDLGELKNNISSFNIFGNLRIRVFINNENASGYYNTFEDNQSCLGNSYNDKISSLVIEYKPYIPGNTTGLSNGKFAAFYTECSYSGNAIRLMPGYYSGEKLGLFKYSIASVEIPAHLRVKVFINNDNLNGQSATLSVNSSCLDYNLRNKIGSLVVEEKEGGNYGGGNNLPVTETVMIYSDANYRGQSVSVLPGTYTTMAMAGGFPDNALSSIKVPSGFRVVLYESENFRGKSFTISESRSGFTAAWNDKISSIIVYRN